MKTPIRFRLGDLNYVAVVQNPLVFAVQKWLEKPENAKLVPAMPDWLLPFSLGIAIATLWFDVLFRDNSRLRELWKILTDKFEIAHLHSGHWNDWNEPGDVMPLTDIGVRLRIRFKRRVKRGRLRLRVFSCTGQGRKPFEDLIDLGKIDVAKGKILDIPLVDLGVPSPGWDHERKRGWGPKKQATLIGLSRNVAVIECEGMFLTQRHRIFVTMVSHHRPDSPPGIYAQDEADDIFDLSEDSRIGIWKYG